MLCVYIKGKYHLKKKLYKERKDQVLIAPSESINIQREVLDIVLVHLNEFYSDSYRINKDSVEVLKSKTNYFFKEFIFVK